MSLLKKARRNFSNVMGIEKGDSDWTIAKKALSSGLPGASGTGMTLGQEDAIGKWTGNENVINEFQSYLSWDPTAERQTESWAQGAKDYVNPPEPETPGPSASEIKFQEEEAARRRKAMSGRSMLRSGGGLGSSGSGTTANLGGVA